MKPAEPDAVRVGSLLFSSAPTPAGGMPLKKPFCLPFTQRRLYTNQGRSRCITYIFQLRVMRSYPHRKCPLHLSSAFTNRANWRTFHPSPADIHSPANCRFLTAQALPLRQRRFWCPRNSREEIAIWPATWPRRCPQPRAVRVQPTGTLNPRPQPPPQSFHVQSKATLRPRP